MEFRINYYSDNDTLLGEEILNYGSYDMAENSIIELLKDDYIKINKTRNGREVRTVILSNKVAKIKITDATPNKVTVRPF